MYADNPDGASQGLVYGDVAVMFLFQGFYSIAWTPLLYLYPLEVMNYSIRANGMAVSQLALNAFALVFVFIMPIGLNNIGWKMYMINGSWDIIIAAFIVSALLLGIVTFADDRRRFFGLRLRARRLRRSMRYSRARDPWYLTLRM